MSAAHLALAEQWQEGGIVQVFAVVVRAHTHVSSCTPIQSYRTYFHLRLHMHNNRLTNVLELEVQLMRGALGGRCASPVRRSKSPLAGCRSQTYMCVICVCEVSTCGVSHIGLLVCVWHNLVK